jgi:hypothetical protein
VSIGSILVFFGTVVKLDNSLPSPYDTTMNYKRAALEQLDWLTEVGRLGPADVAFRQALVYAILSLGQTDEVENVARCAVAFITDDNPETKAMSFMALTKAVEGLVGGRA